MSVHDEPKKARLFSVKQGEELKVSAWELAHFRTPEEEQVYQLAQEEQEVQQIRLAQEEEEKLRREAQEKGYEAGYQKGYEEGLAKALAEGEQQQKVLLQQIAQQMDEVIQGFVTPYAELEEVVYEKMAALALAVAQKVVQQEIMQSSDRVITVFKKTLAQLPAVQDQIEVWVHPELVDILEAYLIQQTDHYSQGWRLLADETLAKGSVKIKHQNSILTSDWQQQLQEVVDQVWQRVVSSGSSSKVEGGDSMAADEPASEVSAQVVQNTVLTTSETS